MFAGTAVDAAAFDELGQGLFGGLGAAFSGVSVVGEFGCVDAEQGLLALGAQTNKRLPKEGAIQRYKGLGEMNDSELWETTMNPETRTLRQITIGEAAAADEIFSILMGEDVDARRSFIQRNAKDVRFLDI